MRSFAPVSAPSSSSDSLSELPALELAARIRRRELSPVEVVRHFAERIERLNPALNAVVWSRPEAALAEARRAEAFLMHGKQLPPLLGLPFTAKECIAVAGAPHTGGSLHHRAAVAKEEAPTVARLRAAGAIPLGVTNASELGLWIESDNPLYGRVENPYVAGHTAGGSSGGEGAAQGAGLSAFGLGSDIGGSVRLPAAFCGVFGHKPSAGRVPVTGNFPSVQGEGRLMLGLGPLTRFASDLHPLLRILSGPDPSDPASFEQPLPAPDPAALEGKKVYVWEDSGPLVSSPSPLVRAALYRAASALESAGAILEPWQPAERALCAAYWVALMKKDPGPAVWEMATGGEKSLLAELFRMAVGKAQVSLPVLAMATGDRLALPKALLSRVEAAAVRLRQTVHARLGGGHLILAPTFPTAAPAHGATLKRPLDFGYTGMFNVLHLPATAIPAGRDEKGLPLSLQVAAGPGADSGTLAAALVLEEVLGGWAPKGA